MTFRETDSMTAIETGQFRGSSTEPKRRGRQPQIPSKGANPPVDDELDRVVDTAVELDETPALSEEALRPSASPAEDPVRLYLKEIGKVSLLKAEEEVTIGHNAVVHACTVRRGALIGMNATVLDGADVGESALVAAGSVVLDRTKVTPRTLWAGAPAKYRRDLTSEEVDALRHYWLNYLEYKVDYLAQDAANVSLAHAGDVAGGP